MKNFVIELSEVIITNIKSIEFSEWGAMLLHQEVIAVIELLEKEAFHIDSTVRPDFGKLLWYLKIITMDQPGDIRRYAISLEDAPFLDEATVRDIMSLRADFSRDIISKVKIGR